uniref:Uncharacterized protein n=1 Tax=Romanomermis culicivorax TaxID=13658 RepID=A0A915KUU8_ROMCU
MSIIDKKCIKKCFTDQKLSWNFSIQLELIKSQLECRIGQIVEFFDSNDSFDLNINDQLSKQADIKSFVGIVRKQA